MVIADDAAFYSSTKTHVGSSTEKAVDIEKQFQSLPEEILTWDDGDPTYPPNFSAWKKARILFILCTFCLCVLSSSSVISTCFRDIERDLNASPDVAILSLSLFVVGLALAPPFVAPLSERCGRMPIYFASLVSFFLLGWPVAFANNFPVMFIFRFLTGLSGSAFLSVVGGTITDMWTARETFIPMALFTACTFAGPVVGPVYGAFVVQYSSLWRWTLWTIQIWAFVEILVLISFCPETFAPAILIKRAKRLRKVTGGNQTTAFEKSFGHKSLLSMIRENVTKIPVLLIREPVLALLCLWMFASFYQTGLTFCSLVVGAAIGTASMPWWRRRYMAQAAEGGIMPPPEAILSTSKLGSFLTVIGLFIFAFTSYARVHWIGPVIGATVFAMGAYCIFFSIFIYSTMAWRPVAASALGANALMRCAFAAGFPLFATQMADKLTSTGAAALLAGINCCLVPVPFLLSRYGANIRARSQFGQS